jgi:cytochrome b subunit of formate dehydrogenase
VPGGNRAAAFLIKRGASEQAAAGLILIGASVLFCFFTQAQLPQFLIAWTAHWHLGPLSLIALILAHIYIGTLGMEGALRDMTDGHV